MNRACCKEQVACGDDLDRAVAVMRAGGVVAFPTETFYGLAVNPFDQMALSRLFAIKKRPRKRAILALVAGQEQLTDLVASVPEVYGGLMDRWWPGPLTLIFPGRPGLPELLTGGTNTVGVRVSSHPLAGRFVTRAGQPITATSANRTGQPPAVQASQLTDLLEPGRDYILEGMAPGGIGSTVVGRDGGGLRLIRAGEVSLASLRESCPFMVGQ